MDPCRSEGDGGGDASRRYLYTPVSITQADNECRLEGDKTHEIFHILSKKVGGDISYVVPTKLKSGGDASPPVPHRSTPVPYFANLSKVWNMPPPYLLSFFFCFQYALHMRSILTTNLAVCVRKILPISALTLLFRLQTSRKFCSHSKIPIRCLWTAFCVPLSFIFYEKQ